MAASVAQGRNSELSQTLHEVQEQTRRSFNSIATDISQADKDKTWEAVQPKIQAQEMRLARELADESMTEQDLRNSQSELDRQLLGAVNQTLEAEIITAEIDSFLADVAAPLFRKS